MTVCRNVHGPRCGGRRRLRMREILGEYLPGSGNGLHDEHVLRDILGIGDGDLVRGCADAALLVEIGLALAGRHVERIPEMQTDGFVARGVRDLIGSEELREIFRVVLVETNDAAGERNAEVASAVLERHVDSDGQLVAKIGLRIAVVVLRTAQLERLTHRNVARIEQRDLFGLLIQYRRGSGERVKVIFKLDFLLERAARAPRSNVCDGAQRLRLNDVHIAGHQLQPRIIVADTARIRKRNQPRQREMLFVGTQRPHIIRAPA